MTELEIFANYGCIAHERETVYTCGTPAGTAVTSDIITVMIPDGWETAENEAGEKLVTVPWGDTYLVNEVLSSKDDRPIFKAIDHDRKTQTVWLEIV